MLDLLSRLFFKCGTVTAQASKFVDIVFLLTYKFFMCMSLQCAEWGKKNDN